MSATFYLSMRCRHCDEEIFEGPTLTLIQHDGLPVIPFDLAAERDFYCEHCRTYNCTGDFEVLTQRVRGGES